MTSPDAEHLTYAPSSGFVGTDTFTYTATDGRDGSNTAVVTLTVSAPGPDGSAGGDEPAGGGGSTGGGGCFINSIHRERVGCILFKILN